MLVLVELCCVCFYFIIYLFEISRLSLNNDAHLSFLCRAKLSDEYNRQVLSVFTQWESDLAKTKEQEEKMQVSSSE